MFSKYFYLGLPISCGPPLERDRLGEGGGGIRNMGRVGKLGWREGGCMGREGESVREEESR